MRHLLISLAAISLILGILGLALPGSALAHEQKTVAQKYSFEVGFLYEPPLVGQMNGVGLAVTIPSQGNKPVEGLENTLKVEVYVGGHADTMALPLEPLEGQPGNYAGHFIPTMSGSYMFRITGTVEGTAVDEDFESGPGRFPDVQPAEMLQFPFKFPDPLTQADSVQTSLDQSSSANTIAWLGFGVGMVGLIAGTFSLVHRKR